MSVEVLAPPSSTTPLKRSKSSKRKHDDVSQSPAAIVADSRPSPTKKPKHSNTESADQSESVAFSLLDSDSPKESAFVVRTLSLYLPVAPIALQTPIPGLCAEHLSPLLLTYFAPLQGVVLSYSNPRLSETANDSSQPAPKYAVSIAEYGASFVWLTADFLVLSPRAGIPIEGFVNLQSETHIGLVCWNLFSATVPRNRLPSDWKWTPAGGNAKSAQGKRKDKLKGGPEADDEEDAMEVDGAVSIEETADNAEDHGHFVDSQGKKVEGALVFAVVGLDAQASSDPQGSFVSIRGTLLDRNGEAEILRKEEEQWARSRARRVNSQRKRPTHTMSGAIPDESIEKLDAPGEKSKAKEKDKGGKKKPKTDKAIH